MSRILNCNPSPRNIKDFIAPKANLSLVTLPLEVDWEPKMSPIFDQLNLGSCTANGGIGLSEYYQIVKTGTFTPLSRLYLYKKERMLEGSDGDTGAYVMDAVRVLATNGACPEIDFPYIVADYNKIPTSKAEQDAFAFKLSEYHRIVDYPSLKASIADGKPVLLGFKVYDSFMDFDVSITGMMPMPLSTENCLGGHCVLACGYKVFSGVEHIKCRNSWGKGWGQNGYFWMPKDYFKDYVFDMWGATLNATYDEINYSQAIQILGDKNIFATPQFWINLGNNHGNDTTGDFRYFGLLFRKFAAYAQDKNKVIGDLNYANITYTQAINIIADHMIMATPQFWINMCDKYNLDSAGDFRYITLAIRKFAAFILLQEAA